MGMMARYVQRLSALVRPARNASPAVSAGVQGFEVDGVRVAWSDVRRLDAYKRDIYSRELLCLALLEADGGVHECNEESLGWQEAGAAIERFLPGALPQAEWTLRLMAGSAGDAVRVYPTSSP